MTSYRFVHVCTSHGVGMPALHKAAAAEAFATAADAQAARGRRKPIKTEVGRYVETRAPALARALEKVLQRHAERIAETASRLLASELGKDFKAVSRRQRIIDELALDDLGLDLNGQLVGAMLAAFKRAARLGLTQVGFDMDEDMTDQVDVAAVEWADARGGVLIKDLAGTTREAMQGVLARAVDEGYSVRDLGKAIMRLGAFSAARAMTIATTELAFAHVNGNVQGWRQTGEVVGKRWILADTHPEPDECDDAADAGQVGLEDEFIEGVKFPPAHPRCLCDVLPVLRDDDDEGSP